MRTLILTAACGLALSAAIILWLGPHAGGWLLIGTVVAVYALAWFVRR